MTHAHTMFAKLRDVGIIEMDAMRQPGAFRQPAAIFEIIQWPHPEGGLAKCLFILRFGEMRMQPAIIALGELRRMTSRSGGRAQGR